MNTMIAIGLVVVAVIFILAAKPGRITDTTLQRLANIAAIVALLAAIIAFAVPSQPAEPVSQTNTVTVTAAHTIQPIPQTTPLITPSVEPTMTFPASPPQMTKVQATGTIVSDVELTPFSTATTPLLANFPAGVSLNVRSIPLTGAGNIITSISGPQQLRVMRSQNEWVQIELPDSRLGWVNGYFLTFEGDADLLSAGLRYRVISDRDDLLFVYGQVINLGGASGIYLLRDPNDAQSYVGWIPAGTEVTVLLKVSGAQIYSSGEWYLVDLVDPGGTKQLLTGYLPIEVVAPLSTQPLVSTTTSTFSSTPTGQSDVTPTPTPFTPEDATKVPMEQDENGNCPYYVPALTLFVDSTNENREGKINVDGSITWNLTELGEGVIVGDAVMAEIDGFLLGDQGVTFFLTSPDPQTRRSLRLKDGAFAIVPPQSGEGTLLLTIRNLECRGTQQQVVRYPLP